MVNEEGRYTQEVGPNLVGEFVLTSGNNKVLEMIQEDIIHKEDYIHSYPYDWRTKQPVILRASQQWFINTDAIKERAIVSFMYIHFEDIRIVDYAGTVVSSRGSPKTDE